MNQHHPGSPFVNQTRPDCWHSEKTEQLHGLRLAVKDLFDVADVPTGAGNPDWLRTHPIASKTASAVEKLVSHGCDYVGKTITDELAYSLNGLNIHFSPLHNSLDSRRICGGSSSGSALAVALNMADIGLGTDTGGSIRVPSSYHGLFGFRPTHGVIATDGVVPLAPDFDTVGWICRDLNTLAKVGDILLPKSTRALEATPVVLDDAVQQCAYSEQLHHWINAHCCGAQSDYSEVSFEMLSIASKSFSVLQGRQIWHTHGNWIEATKPQFANDINRRFQWCKTLTKQDELCAQEHQLHLVKVLNRMLVNDHVLVLPTTPGPAPLLNSDAKWLADYRNSLLAFTCIAGLAGLPQIHLPVFRTNTEAFGVSLIGPKHSDRELIAYAQQILEK